MRDIPESSTDTVSEFNKADRLCQKNHKANFTS